ncbi:MAG: DUF465 domain-containing protein [Pseudomonadota bacterium]
MNDELPSELHDRLEALRRQHRELDVEIEDHVARGLPDQLFVQRLKRRKLQLKDEITRVEAQILPDIIA